MQGKEEGRKGVRVWRGGRGGGGAGTWCTLTLALTAAPDKCNGKTSGFLLHVKWFIVSSSPRSL